MGVLDIITGILGFGFKLYNQLSEQDQQKIKDNFAKQQAETLGEIVGFDAELAKLVANHEKLKKERGETPVDVALAENKRLAAIVERARAAGFNVDES